MTNKPARPVIALLGSSWISLAGAFLVTTAFLTFLFALPAQIRGDSSNPYIGILIFVILPIAFFLGLLLIPIGVWVARRKVEHTVFDPATDRKVALRRIGQFLAVTTALNLLAGTQLTYRAVAHMESVQFCGETCHVMKPEFSAYQNSPHSHVKCAECHVAPGFNGWAESKMAGTRQLMGVTFNNFDRPIKSAIESGKLVSATETCENCHWTRMFNETKVRVIGNYAEDEANKRTATVLAMLVGGGRAVGIHGAHSAPGVEIRYAPGDSKRETIPWVEYRNKQTGEVTTYTLAGAKAADIKNRKTYRMQCVDCHNRPAHAFDVPDKGIDKAMDRGEIPSDLPFVKKKGMELLKTSYSSNGEASSKIPERLHAYYKQAYPALYPRRQQEIDRAGKSLAAIYNRNVFPDLKVTWGTYSNQLGHTDSPGCFRCHDGDHVAAGGKAITNECNACHQILATDEASPEILKTLGLADKIAALSRPAPLGQTVETK